LLAAPFSLPWGSSVYAKIIATNLVSSSAASDLGNGAIILTNPDAPLQLQNVPATTNASRIGLSWVTGSANGGTAVIDYRISWDQGTNNYIVLASNIGTTSYTTLAALSANTVYKFKVEARNSFGFSLNYSNEVSIRAASIPSAPLNLANNAAITASGIVGLIWSSGSSNGGSPIIDYQIS
jgi:hypothetical protein